MNGDSLEFMSIHFEKQLSVFQGGRKVGITVKGVPKDVHKSTPHAPVPIAKANAHINEKLVNPILKVLSSYSEIAQLSTPHIVVEFSENLVSLESEADKDNGKKNDINLNDIDTRAIEYQPTSPKWSFDQVILPNSVRRELEIVINIIQFEPLVFDEWGLRAIEPYPRSAINFHGAPGTGKTMTAHAIASKLDKKILIATYAQIESQYHGEGPKNLEAVFHAAERENAVLFIDEADSLLSKRLSNVTQGSEQAINSMRSQLLICLEKYHGIVIFSTNLVSNYDYAFETRVNHVYFPLPDRETRKAIWRVHLVPQMPTSEEIHIDDLSERFTTFCGRDIKNAVIQAAIHAAMEKGLINNSYLISACERIEHAQKQLQQAHTSRPKDHYEMNLNFEQFTKIEDTKKEVL